jgi:hypothetical protein
MMFELGASDIGMLNKFGGKGFYDGGWMQLIKD